MMGIMDSSISNETSNHIMKAPQTHLAFYKELGVSPVHQDISDLGQHIDRRRSLYRSLGVLPKLIHKARVLEVAPGSGHNSLFIAACQPTNLTMVEPNPVGVQEIKELYAGFDLQHTMPKLVDSKLEDYQPDDTFDIVICEGWLGSAPHEHDMLAKLGSMVSPGGVLCISLVSPIGLLANILRRLLTVQVTSGIDAQEHISLLKTAFAPHLNTLSDMSRPHEDWVIDNMINPAWYGVCLTPTMTVNVLGDTFDHYGFSPRMISDLRWYKSLYGDNRNFNAAFLDSFYCAAHNLLDHRKQADAQDSTHNRQIEDVCFDLLKKVMAFEFDGAGIEPVLKILETLKPMIQVVSPEMERAIVETQTLLDQTALRPEHIANMDRLTPLFGREMMYTSFTRES